MTNKVATVEVPYLMLLVSIIVGAVALGTPTATAQEPAAKTFQLRAYDVGDLILNIEDHPYSESLQNAPAASVGSGGGGGFFSVPAEHQDQAAAGTSNISRLVQIGRNTHPQSLIQLCQFGGGGGGGGGGRGGDAFATAEASGPTASISINDMIRVLTSTVAYDSWAENGGEGRVEPLGTTLLVWQTAEVHEQIKELLKGIRTGSAERKTVMIDARWLLLNSDDLESLILPDQAGVQQVDPSRLAEFTRRPGSIRGITNCFSSQLVYLISGTRRNVVSSYIPVVGSLEWPEHNSLVAASENESLIRFAAETSPVGDKREPKVGYQPIVEKPNLGALLEIRPTLVPSDNTVVVDLKSTLTVLGKKPVEPAAQTASDALAPAVDRIAIETQEFATTLRMPRGKPVLVGGLTYMPGQVESSEQIGPDQSRQAKGAATESPQLYLVLEVR